MADNTTFNVQEETSKIFKDAKRVGSLRDSMLAHAASYGVEEIEQLFPEAKNLSKEPKFLNNPVEWVNKVLGKINKLPFAKVKMLFADITSDTVRAKGYVKGNLKEEDVFGLLKRVTEPTTIYKKGKLDRDDIIDITDFEIVAWIKSAMRLKLEEELARAILLGDGRLASDNDKIDEECIRPIVSDSELYSVKVEVPNAENKYKAFIDTCVKSRKLYKGSGQPDLYTTEDLIAELLCLEDSTGRKIYKNVGELATTLRVGEIIPVAPLEGFIRKTEDGKVHNVMGIIANLSDYSIGANEGGQVSMFDDFDIDYNQQKYLIETRCSGASTTPYSALVIEDVEDPQQASFEVDITEE